MKTVLRLKYIIILALLIITVNLLFLSESIAEFFSVTISRYLNIAISSIFSVFGNFSIAEWLFLFLIIFLIIKIIQIIINLIKLRFLKVKKSLLRLAYAILFIVLLINLTITSGYSRRTLDAPLNLTLEQLNEEKLRGASIYYNAELASASLISRKANGDIDLPYSFLELNDLINLEYQKLEGNYFTKHSFTAKQIILSDVLISFNISGMYFPLTCEPNINITCPPYQLPVIMAHELAHAAGVMREDEANFLAYYICINSGNEYLRYSGLMYASRILLNNYANYNKEAALALYNLLPADVRDEYGNAATFYQGHTNDFLSSVADFFNNLWLNSNKVSDGTKSYSYTAVRLHALYKNLNV
ncbi:MAG: DUF3810 domain-containing protein [Firmicutes bacterium]|nr:DUF3810 domain-containing protein [Bacillota bacterium]